MECVFFSNSTVDSLYYYQEVYLMPLVVLPRIETSVLSGVNIVDYDPLERLETVERYRGVLFEESSHQLAPDTVGRNLNSVILQSKEGERG